LAIARNLAVYEPDQVILHGEFIYDQHPFVRWRNFHYAAIFLAVHHHEQRRGCGQPVQEPAVYGDPVPRPCHIKRGIVS